MSLKHWLAALALWPALIVAASAPAPSLKALLVDGQANPYHEWKKTSPIVKRALEETGLFTVDVATVLPGTAKDFKPKFSDYQVVVLNYEGEEWPAETKKAFEDYVAGGGGLVVFHAADNAFAQWKAYNEMIGVGGWEAATKRTARSSIGRTARSSATRRPAPAAATAPSIPINWSSARPTIR